MEIQNLKQLLRVKLIKIKKKNEIPEDIKSLSFNLFPRGSTSDLTNTSISNRQNNIFSYSTNKYLPKRLTKLEIKESFSPSIYKSFLSPKISNNYQVNLSQNFDKMMKEMKSCFNYSKIKLKNDYKEKMGLFIEDLKKMKIKSDNIISDINKYNYFQLFEKIILCIQEQEKIFFDNKDIIINEKDILKIIISNIDEYNIIIRKLLNILISELNLKIEKNNFLIKYNKELEKEKLIYKKEIKNLKKLLNKYKLNKFDVDNINKIKLDFLKEKNDYIISIDKLNNEIKDLYFLLGKNKNYYEKYKKDENLIKNMKVEKIEIKNKYSNEINKLNEENIVYKLNIKNLYKTIEDLNNSINIIKQKEDNYIKDKLEIKHLKAVNNKIYENYLMLNEEFNTFLFLQNKKNNYNDI